MRKFNQCKQRLYHMCTSMMIITNHIIITTIILPNTNHPTIFFKIQKIFLPLQVKLLFMIFSSGRNNKESCRILQSPLELRLSKYHKLAKLSACLNKPQVNFAKLKLQGVILKTSSLPLMYKSLNLASLFIICGLVNLFVTN